MKQIEPPLAGPCSADSPSAGPSGLGQDIRLEGIGVSPGIAIGPVFGVVEIEAPQERRPIAAHEVEHERAQLSRAVEESRRQLEKLRQGLRELPEAGQEELSALIDVYQRMLANSRLVRGAHRRIETALVSAATAVVDEVEATVAAVLAPGGEWAERTMRARQASEIQEVGQRLLRTLASTPFRSFKAAPRGAVLVCEMLRPSDAALLDPAVIAGVVTEEGGADGHVAIMLRALGIPSVLGVPALMHTIRQLTVPGLVLHMVLDGERGVVTVNPSNHTRQQAKQGLAAHQQEALVLAQLSRLPAVTTDGEAVLLQANIELPAELPQMVRSGAGGIGLLRTEFLFMNRESLPDLTTQIETYSHVIAAAEGEQVTIRVLDWGGEKESEALRTAGLLRSETEHNPALGLRGIRLLLAHPELLETQLTAILRAARDVRAESRVRILLPMITTLQEMRTARTIYTRILHHEAWDGAALPLGAMIETPAAALIVEELAKESDFLAIGTNDLAMYTLAVDRGDAGLAGLYDPLHPALLRLIAACASAAARAGKPMSLCGEIAGNPAAIPVLLGLGFRQFSMGAGAVPRVKKAIRATSLDQARRAAQEALTII
ncbi:Phosphoenolpyruvate-protein phosphotransferase [Granulibacter bethesdensis]|uniref:Phosphoenolpyruvate-protein phosphotransferase n=1 Tax=Granulibacter bethesdensis TaxID=364410 RepID=A0AAN0RCC7_9PROT|nr:phosphoenolpyruvate--protein phosphotransferase [Granulibacter bethesdensis]AHJ62166.1 Phosphoenolpyruvate-protein phosphotransferase [Granulibacter bethesdensis]AHJ64791.1 Phosphoenolpyruvate-protein phosphotransferase [Granulibacter bethesdensis CGDNIH4]